MTSFLLVLFTVAWAAVAFAVFRALVIAWGYERRIAAVTAVAVAGAFFLGAASPIALWQRNAMLAAAPAPSPTASPTAPVGQAAHCPDGAKAGTVTGQGHIDTIAVGTASAVAATPDISVPAGARIRVGGWAVAAGGPATALCVLVDGRLIPYAGQFRLDRPDVAAALGKPQDAASGFDVSVQLASGTHALTVGSAAADGTVAPLAPPLTVHAR